MPATVPGAVHRDALQRTAANCGATRRCDTATLSRAAGRRGAEAALAARRAARVISPSAECRRVNTGTRRGCRSEEVTGRHGAARGAGTAGEAVLSGACSVQRAGRLKVRRRAHDGEED